MPPERTHKFRCPWPDLCHRGGGTRADELTPARRLDYLRRAEGFVVITVVGCTRNCDRVSTRFRPCAFQRRQIVVVETIESEDQQVIDDDWRRAGAAKVKTG